MGGPLKLRLEGVEETLLIPLYARARETRRWGGLVRDPHALALVERLDYDFSKLANDPFTQLCVALRTEILDRATRAFLAAHPDALVLNLGAGLDTRFDRLDNGRVTWVEVDLPGPMAVRRALMPDTERHVTVAASVLEAAWAEAIDRAPGRPVLIVLEGLVMYFTPEQVRALIDRLAQRFPGAEVLMETVSPQAVAQADTYFERRRVAARWQSGLGDGRELEAWNPRVHVLEVWHYFDRHLWRQGRFAFARWVPALRDFFAIVRLRLD